MRRADIVWFGRCVHPPAEFGERGVRIGTIGG
jgi:hypothetical protein